MEQYNEYRCGYGHVTLVEKANYLLPDELTCIVCNGRSLLNGLVTARVVHPNHGTYSAYTHGCHCDQCKEANRIYQQDRRKGTHYARTNGGTYREQAHADLVRYMEQAQ